MRFLKHLERTRLLLHLVDIAAQDSNVDPARQVALIADELVRFSPELAVRGVGLCSKKDLLSGRVWSIEWLLWWKISSGKGRCSLYPF